MYSSIEVEGRKEVIDNCYWPLIRLAQKGIPIGVEVTGVTLEIINSISPEWVSVFKKCISKNEIELIGSGYSQVIGPLVPAKVNENNQTIGMKQYEEVLGSKPQVALINEMAYSSGIVDHYIEAGYEAIVMEWNNPRRYHPGWKDEWRYFPQRVQSSAGNSIKIIWADSIAFQKYQRYVHNEVGLEEYLKYLKSSTKNDVNFPLYSNDIEIFDYRPNRYGTEATIVDRHEWVRIYDLYQHLDEQDWCELIFPTAVLDDIDTENANHLLRLESIEQPIPVKKQEKYNITRWALTGRNDLDINTKCFQIYESMVYQKNENPEDWKELCYLWSSDFRTHISEKRWQKYIVALDDRVSHINSENEDENLFGSNSTNIKNAPNGLKLIDYEVGKFKITLNMNKGLSIFALGHKDSGYLPLIGTLDHGFYDDITLGADFYSGHAVIERFGKHKITDLGKVSPSIVETENEVILKTIQDMNGFRFNNIIRISENRFTMEKNIHAKVNEKMIIRPYCFTFIPTEWDKDSLYVETNNGSLFTERFHLERGDISHSDMYSSLISARHGFGNTEGIIVIGDKNKMVTFKCEMSKSALIPSLIFKELQNTYFFRLQYSAMEIDETSKLITTPVAIHSRLSISVSI